MRVFWLKRDKLIDELRKKAQEIGKKDSRIVKIVLFGSLAENRAVPGSDADVLILLEKDERPLTERISAYLKEFDINFPVEVFPYTINENVPIIKSALEKGIILFDRSRDLP